MRIQNARTLKELEKVSGLQTLEIPTFLGAVITPVVNVNPLEFEEINIVAQNDSSSTGTVTIHTCSATKDTYLRGLFLSSAYNATADSVLTGLIATPFNQAARELLGQTKITLTADAQSTQIMFPVPIRLKRSSLITATMTFTVGSGIMHATVFCTEREAFDNA